MKRILVTSAGGAPATNFVRSLRLAPEPFYLIGTDADPYHLMRAETDVRYLVPPIEDSHFLSAICAVIKKEKAEFVHIQNDGELFWFSEHRDKIPARLFLPKRRVVRACQDKFASYRAWTKADLTVPQTIMLSSPTDVTRAFRNLSPPLWIRAMRGASGKYSLVVSTPELATTWVALHDGWGAFTAAELLEKQSVTWMSVWFEGKLLVAQGRKRLYWEASHVSPTGVTGITGAGETIDDPQLDRLAQDAIRAIDPSPHGLYGVDLCLDRNGVPNPTEINIGRFFTTHLFFTQAGVNMPYIYIKYAFGEPIPLPKKHINPLPAGLIWIRGVDFLPILIPRRKLVFPTFPKKERRRVRKTKKLNRK